MKSHVKERTVNTRIITARNNILPYFSDIKIIDIKPIAIRNWQNSLLEKGLSLNYLKSIENQFNSIINFGIKFYGIEKNIFSNIDRIGKRKSKKVSIWKPDEFQKFILSIDREKNLPYYVLFNILFYTGVRIGEALALNIKDIDTTNKAININKTYYKFNKKEYITEPKTEECNRILKIPDDLNIILSNYIQKNYNEEGYLFRNSRESIRSFFIQKIQENNLPAIRIHDLRHSHASFLIQNNINILAISKRLGYSNIEMTLNTYSHLYEEENLKLIDILNNMQQRGCLKIEIY